MSQVPQYKSKHPRCFGVSRLTRLVIPGYFYSFQTPRLKDFASSAKTKESQMQEPAAWKVKLQGYPTDKKMHPPRTLP